MAAAGVLGAAFRVRAGAFGGQVFSGRQDAGRTACVCLCVRADGGRGYRVGSVRGTCCPRRCYASVALRVTIGRTARVTRNFETRDEASNNGPPCLGDIFLFRQLMIFCQLGRLGRRLWKAFARRQIRLAFGSWADGGQPSLIG
jgi:hypothetical protein